MRLVAPSLTLSIILLSSCNRDATCPNEPCFKNGAYTVDTSVVVDDSGETDVIDDSGETDPPDDSGGIPEGGDIDNPGDHATFSVDDEQVNLSDASGDESNADMDFYVILVNPSEDALGYRLHYAPHLGEDDPGPPPLAMPSALRREAPAPRRDTASPPPKPPLEESDIGSRQGEFHVRNSVEDTNSYDVVTATLWALGDSVSIWVDNDQPIDWDVDCDGIVDVPDQFDAYGFDNCDLQTVADIVDTNIIVNLRDLYGSESDINSDSRVSVVITPVLNNMPLTHTDEDEWGQVVGSYADPEVDLNDFNYTTNPGSDEQEVIYVFAPDPHGFYNPFNPTTVDEFTSMSLSAEIARSFVKLVVYNYRVLEGDEGAEAEELWLTEALAAVGADICGFGAIYYDDAWSYMDAPYLYSLTGFEDDSIVSTEPKGAQYLFMRWLVDVFGTGVLAELTQTDELGTDNVEAVGAIDDSGYDFADLVMLWQVALLSTGVNNVDGDPLLDPSDFPPYATPTFISAPDTAPSTPTPGVYYGANGYQSGFAPRGINRWVEDGTTADPEENEGKRVVTEGTDPHTFVPGYAYFGYNEGGYSASVTRLTQIEYDNTELRIQTEGSGMSGVVIRWNDADRDDLAVENIYSPLSVDDLLLPPLPSDGGQIQAIGDIRDDVNIVVIDEESSATSTAAVADLDRWLLDLTDRTNGEVIELGIWIDRRFEDASGNAAPYDPWIAILRAGVLPTPTVSATNSGTCSTSQWLWSYPNKVISYVHAQDYLVTTLGVDAEFTGCDEPTGGYTCDVDWDLDGVLDTDESQPETFMDQVWAAQCEVDSNLNENTAFSFEFVDADELDEDEIVGLSAISNIGGVSGPEGEEALLEASVIGGQKYVIVVSGGGDTGTYELSIRQTNY